MLNTPASNLLARLASTGAASMLEREGFSSSRDQSATGNDTAALRVSMQSNTSSIHNDTNAVPKPNPIPDVKDDSVSHSARFSSVHGMSVDKFKKQLLKRANIVAEILEGEKSIVRNYACVVKYYLAPIRFSVSEADSTLLKVRVRQFRTTLFLPCFCFVLAVRTSCLATSSPRFVLTKCNSRCRRSLHFLHFGQHSMQLTLSSCKPCQRWAVNYAESKLSMFCFVILLFSSCPRSPPCHGKPSCFRIVFALTD